VALRARQRFTGACRPKELPDVQEGSGRRLIRKQTRCAARLLMARRRNPLCFHEK
jgi:hypothetical protein